MSFRLIFILVAATLVTAAAFSTNPGSVLIYDWALTYTPGTPPSSGLPTDVVTAGLTTLIFEADFSQPQYNSPISNWIGGCGASITYPPGGWQYDIFSHNGAAPCSRITMETDLLAGGKQVLHLHWDHLADNPLTRYELAYPQLPFSSSANDFPLELYTETVFRQTRSSLLQGQQMLNFSQYFASGALPGTSHIDPNMFEVHATANSGDTTWDFGNGWGEFCASGNQCGGADIGSRFLDLTAYHTIGYLDTYDNVGRYSQCVYVDRQKLACAPNNLVNPSVMTQHNKVLDMGWGGSAGFNWSITNDMDIYVQKIDVWACPNSFQTSTNCGGVLISN